MRRKLEAHTQHDRPALQSAAGNGPTRLTQQAATDASSGSRFNTHRFTEAPDYPGALEIPGRTNMTPEEIAKALADWEAHQKVKAEVAARAKR
jgi:hypothetical protein